MIDLISVIGVYRGYRRKSEVGGCCDWKINAGSGKAEVELVA